MDKEPSPPTSSSPPFNLRELLQGEHVLPYFQPIISIDRRSIIGVEGLSRGFHPVQKTLIPPTELFHQAAIQGVSLELDRLCRKKVLDDFRRFRMDHPDLFLSLNLDAANFEQEVEGIDHLRHQVKEMGLEPRQIALEVIESAVRDPDELQRYIDLYRGYGFLIALDDVGAGHSNLNRVSQIRPDILKLDRFLIQNVQLDTYKQEVVRSLMNMTRRLGTLVIAEGVETVEEAICLLDMDVDLIQGYFFSKPYPFDQLEKNWVNEKVRGLVGIYKDGHLKRVGMRRTHIVRYYAVVMEVQIALMKRDNGGLDEALKLVAPRLPGVDSLYVLDEKGIQLSECLCMENGQVRRNSVIFKPTPKGSDHSMKDYFYLLMEPGQTDNSFVTDPYLSMISGRSCVTFSSHFKDQNGKKLVLCMEINTETLRQEPAAG